MARKTIIEEDVDMDLDMDEYGGLKPSYEAIVKKCKCGYKGELILDVDGYCCENCGYLLIDNSR